jgi:hypothetical protein
MDYVAIYLPNGIPSLDWLKTRPGVKEVREDQDRGSMSSYVIEFLTVRITMNVMPEDQVPGHLSGFSNFVLSKHLEIHSQNTKTLLERIAQTKNVLGCSIAPRLDTDGYVGGFLTSIAADFHGLMFDGSKILGSDGNPIFPSDPH